jgi:D-alanyl-D-alanine carboxypeptidase/D-alanyl-D-alanine-endopeptidase (penicillin-binding protein 4)
MEAFTSFIIETLNFSAMYDVMKKLFFLSALVLSFNGYGQTLTEKLSKAFQVFDSDSQLRSAITSLYVVDAKTGSVLFDRNSTVGLATASTLKIVTAATAYELLGADFRYPTVFGYTGTLTAKTVKGNLYIKPSGDPTLGSWRWRYTSDTAVMNQFMDAVKKAGISGYNSLAITKSGWDKESIPDGWIWQDIGNYYGAGARGFNWRENQFDVILRSGATVGDPVTIVQKRPGYTKAGLFSSAVSAAKGSGDNAYVYYPLLYQEGIVRGTIPVNENAFVISAANPDPAGDFSLWAMDNLLHKEKIGRVKSDSSSTDSTVLFTHVSPPLDSIVYWFLKKSINLYGEALTKTLAYQKMGMGATEEGVAIIKSFWKEKGISPVELNIVDGSGLSPLNRVTTRAQVRILQYAKTQPWFKGFFDALPEYNKMKMKSGTINGVKGFCGYHTSGGGNDYIFSFLVNNYNGSASEVVQKMYKVLDVLK